MRGWILAVLAIVGLVRLVTIDHTPAARGAELPPVVTQEEPEQPKAEVEALPPVQKAGPSLEERVAKLEAIQVLVADSLKRQDEVNKDTVGALEKLVAQLENMRPCQCQPPAMNAPPRAPLQALGDMLRPNQMRGQAPPEMRIVFIYGDGCPPCKAWDVSSDKAGAIRDGYTIQPQPDSEGGPVPRYVIYRGTAYWRHNGYLTYQRLKEIERELIRSVGR